MAAADPYPVLKLLQSHLEGQLRQGTNRLWLTPEAADSLRAIVRMRPQPRPRGSLSVSPSPAGLAAPEDSAPAEAHPAPAVQRADLPVSSLPPFSRKDKEEQLASLHARFGREGSSGNADRFIEPAGNPMAGILLIGGAPGPEEAESGKPFAGAAGGLLDKVLKAMGLSREEVYLTYVSKWFPGSGEPQTPAPAALGTAAGQAWLREEINLVQPKVIVALGTGVPAGLPGLLPDGEPGRGQWIAFDGIPMLVTIHPSVLLESEPLGPAVANAEKRRFWEEFMEVMEKAGMSVSDRQRSYFLTR